MSDRPVPVIPSGVLTDEQVQKISGGLDLCSAQEINELLGSLKESYDTLVDFTSYVIERVATSTP